jgi:peroxiredoxin
MQFRQLITVPLRVGDRTRRRVEVGALITPQQLTTISGDRLRVPDRDTLIHLQFRRYAGCPFCNLHLRSIVQRHDEIVAAGVREVVVFHSTVTELLAYQSDLPLAVVADPNKKLYKEFGVEASARALLMPGAWGPGLQAVWRALRRRALRIPDLHGGALGLPADFLIARDGRVVARKYGAHAYDQWPVDELLGLVTRESNPGLRV